MNGNRFDQGGFVAKIREIKTLYLYIALAAIVSLVLMNILVFPIALAAVKIPVWYSRIIPWVITVLTLGSLGFVFFQRIKALRTDGISYSSIFSRALKKAAVSFIFFFGIFLATGIFITIVYFLLSFDYRLLYELMR